MKKGAIQPGVWPVDTLILCCRDFEQVVRGRARRRAFDVPGEVDAYFAPGRVAYRAPGAWAPVALMMAALFGCMGVSLPVMSWTLHADTSAWLSALMWFGAGALQLFYLCCAMFLLARVRSQGLRLFKVLAGFHLAWGVAGSAAALGGSAGAAAASCALLSGALIWLLLNSAAFFSWVNFHLTARKVMHNRLQQRMARRQQPARRGGQA